MLQLGVFLSQISDKSVLVRYYIFIFQLRLFELLNVIDNRFSVKSAERSLFKKNFLFHSCDHPFRRIIRNKEFALHRRRT